MMTQAHRQTLLFFSLPLPHSVLPFPLAAAPPPGQLKEPRAVSSVWREPAEAFKRAGGCAASGAPPTHPETPT